MPPIDSKLRKCLDVMRCVQCAGKLEPHETHLSCVACGRRFPVRSGIAVLLDDEDTAGQPRAGYMEALFRFPSFYRLKFNVLRILNRTDDLELTEFLRDKTVLDVGCGPFSYGYDTTLPRSIVGLDLSPQFVRTASEQDPAHLYLVANAKKIPFADGTFDTALLRFVIHHIPGDTALLLREVARVTHGHVIIFDHVRSDVPWQRAVQDTYWQTFDSGHHYNTMSEWDELLRPYRVAAFRRTGKMFGNVCQMVLEVGNEATK